MDVRATETITFSGGNQAAAVRVPPDVSPRELVAALGLPQPRALLVLNGGTAELEPALERQLQRQIADGLARVAAEEGITVVTGGTDAGVFRLLGQGLHQWGRTAPCIGVAVNDLVAVPGQRDSDTRLEPQHSHFVLVEGQQWGDETSTMYALVRELGRQCPAVAVFAGGGEIVKQELEANIQDGRPMILLAGSGRTTDAVLEASEQPQASDPRLAEIALQGQITRFALEQEPAALRALVRRMLTLDQR